MNNHIDTAGLAVELESKPCPLGCPRNDKVLFSGMDRLHNLPGEFTVVRCQVCGLMRTDPRPTAETMGYYYPDDYGPYQSTLVKETVRLSKSRQFMNKIFYALLFYRMHTLATVLPDRRPGRALEVGCASGSFMMKLKDRGWDIEGLEFNASAAHNAKSLGFRVYTGSLEDAPNPDNPYDLIIGWMVIEHLHDPASGLKKLHTWTRPGGWLAISVPDAGSLEFRIFKDYWYALQLPNHLYHFTTRTLKKLLEQCGWQVEKVYHQRVLSNLMGSIGLFLASKKITSPLGRKFLGFIQRGKTQHFLSPIAYILALLGQTGRITVWARKQDI